MSLQKAIEILEHANRDALIVNDWGFDFRRGFYCAIEVLQREKKGYIYCTMGDTQYKKNLTAWIERKKYQRHWERDKYVTTWCSTSVTVCPRITEEGQG